MRVVFAECVRRNLPRLRRWVGEEAGGIYSEFEAAPTDEEVERKVQTQRFILDSQVLKA